MSDHSSPSSDVSENSELTESFDVSDLPLDNLHLETGLSSDITDIERQQIESFFSGLGTEVSVINKGNLSALIDQNEKKCDKFSNAFLFKWFGALGVNCVEREMFSHQIIKQDVIKTSWFDSQKGEEK